MDMDAGRLAAAFGSVVRELRKGKGFSQEAFAYHCGVHRTFMGLIERGQPDISLSSAMKIAEGLDMTLAELLADVESRYRLPSQT